MVHYGHYSFQSLYQESFPNRTMYLTVEQENHHLTFKNSTEQNHVTFPNREESYLGKDIN